jgi:predicted small metal-binding protein
MILARTTRESVRCCLCNWTRGDMSFAEADRLLVEHLRDQHGRDPRLICRTEVKNGYTERLWNKVRERWPLCEYSGPSYGGWRKMQQFGGGV